MLSSLFSFYLLIKEKRKKREYKILFTFLFEKLLQLYCSNGLLLHFVGDAVFGSHFENIYLFIFTIYLQIY
jgi:hypothetical protein